MKLLLVVLVTLLLAACGSPAPVPPAPSGIGAVNVSAAQPVTLAASDLPVWGATGWVGVPEPDAAITPSKGSVFVISYPTNSATIPMSEVRGVRSLAPYLVNTPSARVQIEGHCDERGSARYNAKLGTRRADGVRALLVANGVRDEQIVVVSYGKSRPVARCHNESCWKLNRRADVVFVRVAE